MNNYASSSNKQIKQEPQSSKTPIVILGPTGVGKTDVALALAEQLDGQIINADSAQMYTPLTIGTAKPDYKKSAIVHHCFDMLNEPVNYNVMQYRQKLIETVTYVQQQNKVPIIVGGSGFYIKSLLYPPTPTTAACNDTAQSGCGVTSQLCDDIGQRGAKEDVTSPPKKITWQALHAIDPVRAAQIHPNDTYRIKRALEIWHQQGLKPSECKPEFKPWTDMIIIWITRERKELYERIDTRVVAMIDVGWINEVEALRGTAWESFLRGKKIIGYDIILDYLDTNERNKEQLIKDIQQKTRNYAKAQLIFWKSFKKQIEASLKTYQGPHQIIILETGPGFAHAGSTDSGSYAGLLSTLKGYWQTG